VAKTVRELVEDLVAERVDVDTVADEFRSRTWPRRRKATDAEVWGVHDDSEPDPNSWDVVTTCSALTLDQYAALAAAYTQAQRAQADRAADLAGFVGRSDARSADGDEQKNKPHLRQRLDDGALRARGIL